MPSFEKLVEYFRQFPGIGPRQATRFAYFILRKSNGFVDELMEAIKEARKSIRQCTESYGYFNSINGETTHPIVRDPNRDRSALMIVEKDSDLSSIEKSGVYNGQYFVLGGRLSVLEKNPEEKIRSRQLIDLLKRRKFEEIIFALSVNPEGEETRQYLSGIIQKEIKRIKMTTLGRGLSTGTELEYIDTDTIKNAMQNRK